MGETEAQVFAYDELDRLTSFEQGRWQGAGFFNAVRSSAHEWTLDELGNWRQHTDRSRSANGPAVTLGVDPVNAYTQWLADDDRDGTIQPSESVTLDYDAARGFLVQQPTSDGKGWKYWHDGFGRLSKVDRCSNTGCIGAPVSTVEYRYTADGRLAWRDRTSDGEPGVWLLYDGSQVIAEQTASERQSWYVWSGTTLVQTRGKLSANGSVDTLHVHQDRIGSVVLATRWDDVHQKVEVWAQRQFDPYGRRVVAAGWERNDPPLPYRFAGQRLDEDTGLYLMGARWYSAELGRFIEQDPIAEGGGLNLYAYVGSSPTLWVDPSGLKGGAPGDPSLGPSRPSDPNKQVKYTIDGVSATDMVTGGVNGAIVTAALNMNTAAQEASDWSATKKIEKAIESATVDEKPNALEADVMVESGAVVVSLALPEPPEGAVEVDPTDSLSVQFGEYFGDLAVNGTLDFVEVVVEDLGTMRSTLSGSALLDTLSRSPGSTSVFETKGPSQTTTTYGELEQLPIGKSEVLINPNKLIDGGYSATTLFHELTHSMHHRLGTSAPGQSSQRYRTPGAMQNSHSTHEKNSERQVIGLDQWSGDLMTEDTFRAELGLHLRRSHQAGSSTLVNTSLTVRPKP